MTENRQAEVNAYYLESMARVGRTPEPKGQKFPCGSLVWIGDMPPSKRHFAQHLFAMVEHVYSHAYGGDNIKDYSLLVQFPEGTAWMDNKKRRWSSVAWYAESELTAVTDQAEIKRLKDDMLKEAAQ